jgi:hypothetical protein
MTLLIAVGLFFAACGGADPELPAGAITTTVDPAGAPGDGDGQPEVVETAPAVDAAALNVPLMPSDDIPEGIPVPVPAGGEPGGLAAFDGESFAVEFPVGNLERIAAFYDAWFADQEIPVEPVFGSFDGRLWRASVQGIPVEIELYELTNAEAERLFITWP